MKKAVLYSLILFVLVACSSVETPPIDQASQEIQEYLDSNFSRKFKISKIDKDYNPDMFHEQWGFKVWLIDTKGVKFGPVFFEKNKHQHAWLTYGGSDIEKEYHEAQTDTLP